MLLVLLGIFLVLLIIGIIWLSKDDSDGAIACATVGGLFSVIIIITMIFVTNNVIAFNNMNERIAIYQEENKRIEEQIKTTVEAYQEYEKEIFGNIDLENITADKLIVLTSIYPELKSDTLVQELISVYVENNNQIKELKAKKLDYKVSCWWLYFGE